MRRFEAIDLIKLRALGSTNGWNEQLTKFYETKNINGLARLRYQIQAGMDDLTRAGLNTDEINTWFCRLNRSIEITAKRIIKLKHPLPIDNPLIAQGSSIYYDAKKERDRALMQFLARSSY